MAKKQKAKDEQAQPVLSRKEQIQIRLRQIDEEAKNEDEGLKFAQGELEKIQEELAEEEAQLAKRVEAIMDAHSGGSNKELMSRVLSEKDPTDRMKHLKEDEENAKQMIEVYKKNKATLNRERKQLIAERRVIRGDEEAKAFVDDFQKTYDHVQICESIYSSMLTHLLALEEIFAENSSGLSPTQWLSKVGAPQWLVELVDVVLPHQRLKPTTFAEFMRRASEHEMGGRNPLFHSFTKSKKYGVRSVYTTGEREESQFGFRTVT